MAREERRIVVSAPVGRTLIVGLVGAAALAAAIVLGVYLASPQTMGPSPTHPHADTLSDVVVYVLVTWPATAILWAFIDREVSLEGDQVFIVRGTGRKVVLARADVKAVHSFPFRNWYVMWVSCARGAPITRSIFFSRSPALPAPKA